MQIENVSGVCFTSGRTLQQQGQCTVSYRMLGQIIVYDEDILALIHEILSQRRTGVRRDVLQGCRIAGGCGYDNGVIHGIVLFQGSYQFCNGRCLLADSHIDTYHILALLVQNRIDGDGSLTGLTVTDDQLTLSTADGEHGIDSQNTGLHRHSYGLSVHNGRCGLLDGTITFFLNGTSAVDGCSQSIHDPALKSVTYGDTGSLTGTYHSGTLTDLGIMTKQDTSDLIPADILYHSLNTGIKDNDLTVLGMVDTIDIGDTVTYPTDGTDLMLLCLEMEIFDLTLQDGNNPLLAGSLTYLGKLVCELLHTTIGTPVIDFVTGTDDETAAQRRVFLRLEDHIVSVIFLLYKITDIL